MEEKGRYNIIFEELYRLQSETEELDTQSFEVESAEAEAISELREIVSEVSEIPSTIFTTTQLPTTTIHKRTIKSEVEHNGSAFFIPFDSVCLVVRFIQHVKLCTF